MRVLIACEFSGTVRDAFSQLGHDAWSCDLLPTEKPGQHIQGNVLEILVDGWDLMVGHPPCTYLTVSGNKWMGHPKFPTREQDREEAIRFFMALYNAPISKVAIENPIGVMSSRFRKPDCVVQPWMFGHGETKATCLWLRGLPRLVPTHTPGGDLLTPPAPEEREQRLHKLPPSAERWKERSKTFPGIARAMAEQWGGYARAVA